MPARVYLKHNPIIILLFKEFIESLTNKEKPPKGDSLCCNARVAPYHLQCLKKQNFL